MCESNFMSCLVRNEPEPLILSLDTFLQQFYALAFKRNGKHIVLPGTCYTWNTLSSSSHIGVEKLRQRFIVHHHKLSFVPQTGEFLMGILLGHHKKAVPNWTGVSFQPNLMHYSQLQINSVNQGVRRESVLFHRDSVAFATLAIFWSKHQQCQLTAVANTGAWDMDEESGERIREC